MPYISRQSGFGVSYENMMCKQGLKQGRRATKTLSVKAMSPDPLLHVVCNMDKVTAHDPVNAHLIRRIIVPMRRAGWLAVFAQPFYFRIYAGESMDSAHPSQVHVNVAFTSDRARTLYAGQLGPATMLSVGTDLKACLDGEELVLQPGERYAIKTGLRIQPLQSGWAGIVSSRSGLGARDGVVVAQGIGLIDPDYTGEIIVYLLNTAREVRRIGNGERIAQLFFVPYGYPSFSEVDDLHPTARGDGGFGHTGR